MLMIKKIRKFLFFGLIACTLPSLAQPLNICLEPQGKKVFENPTGIIWLERRNGWFVLEKRGRLYFYDAQNNVKELVANWQKRVNDSFEGGLLSVALDPNFFENRYIYTHMTLAGEETISAIERWTISSDGLVQLDSLKTILTQIQPYDNHNGGRIAFGPDGYLYVGFGDGGLAGDPNANAQNVSNLLGAILRINVHTQERYLIPEDNPFLLSSFDKYHAPMKKESRPEIYAWGLRNPWQFSFDSLTGDLWLADVGENQQEEINLILKGHNYGWDCYEGTLEFEPNNWCTANKKLLDFPYTTYSRSLGKSVVGGYVYRGEKYTDWFGKYFFADFISGRIWTFPTSKLLLKKKRQPFHETYKGNMFISSFAEDGEGELYVVGYYSGRIYALKEQCKKH